MGRKYQVQARTGKLWTVSTKCRLEQVNNEQEVPVQTRTGKLWAGSTKFRLEQGNYGQEVPSAG